MLNFEPISLDRQSDYLSLLRHCPVVASDYSFINLWGWAEEYGLQWAWAPPLLWIRQTRPETVFWAPAGAWIEADWQKQLTSLAPEAPVFIRVPEMLVNLWNDIFKTRMQVDSTRGQWDYLYDTDDLIELKGNRYHKKKNLLNQFKKKYDYRYLSLGHEMVEKILAMQSDWCEWRDCELYESLAAENRVIEKVLSAWPNFRNISGGAICMEEKIAAYAIGERLDKETLLIHFEKGSPGISGVYQAINQIFIESQATKDGGGFRLVNRMQDLDDEGLRKAKLSYQPREFIRKYKVVLHP